MSERIVFHIDVNNAFLSWTAVKLLKEGYKRDIRTIAAVIGGDESKRRGIVLAKSPIAKKYNIVTAETIYQARRKCPSLQVFSPDFAWYKEKSRELFTYLLKYSPTMEQFSIDECFLDMSGTNYLYKDYVALAYQIKDEIKEKFGYTVNIGVANNKLCAKMASDFEKPDKVHTLFKDEVKTKLWPLPVTDLLMVGKSTGQELKKLNINTIGDLAMTEDRVLISHFKSQAQYLKQAAWGIDDSRVEKRSGKVESISISETLAYDVTDKDKLKEVLLIFTENITRELRNKKKFAQGVAVFYKTNTFINYSAQERLTNPSNNTREIYKKVVEVFEKSYKENPIRLIGVRLIDLTTKSDKQLSIFSEDNNEEASTIQRTLDNINMRFGKTLIAPASIKLINRNKDK